MKLYWEKLSCLCTPFAFVRRWLLLIIQLWPKIKWYLVNKFVFRTWPNFVQLSVNFYWWIFPMAKLVVMHISTRRACMRFDKKLCFSKFVELLMRWKHITTFKVTWINFCPSSIDSWSTKYCLPQYALQFSWRCTKCMTRDWYKSDKIKTSQRINSCAMFNKRMYSTH